MTAWEAAQTRPVDEIAAEVWEQMDGRGGSDPLAPWADLALALCERVKTAERERDEARAMVAALEVRIESWRELRADAHAETERLKGTLQEWVEAEDARASGGAAYKLVNRLRDARAAARAALETGRIA